MNVSRLVAISRKEFLHIGRDPRSLGLAFLLPMVMLIIFGYALSLDVDRVPLLVLDWSGTPQSRDLISRFAGSRYFTLVGMAAGERDIERAIEDGSALVGLIIPEGFGPAVNAGQTAHVQMLFDGSDANTALIAQGYADAIAAEFSQKTTLEWVHRAGSRTSAAPVDVRTRVWYNEDLESKNFIIPGIMAVILMIVAAMLIPLSIVRERETGTIEQLISTPVKAHELVLGKMIPYFVIGMGDVLLTIAVGRFGFAIPLRGSIWLLLGTSALYLVAGLSLGIFISIVSDSQLAASQKALVVSFLPAFLLSGFMSPIDQMPSWLQFITHFFPARYFVTILKGIYLKGLGAAALAGEIGFTALFAFVLFALAIGKFKKRLV